MISPRWLLVGCLTAFIFAENSRAAEPPTAPAPDWNAVASFAIQLQDADPAQLAASPFRLIVMDATRDGTDATSYTKADIQRIQSGNKAAAPKLVLGYVSLGEVENFRTYWRKDWDKHPPSWIGPEDPEWKGDFKVRFWDPAWPPLMEKAIDHLIDLGYDGAFLDVVDAGKFWADEARGAARRPDAEREMVDLVAHLRAHANARRPGFGLFPNGGENLGRFPKYLDAISGLFREDIWYNGNHRNSPAELNGTLKALKPFTAAHKPIFAIDYVTKPPLIDDFYLKAHAAGFISYATVRPLNKLTINPGHDGADVSQKKQPAYHYLDCLPSK